MALTLILLLMVSLILYAPLFKPAEQAVQAFAQSPTLHAITAKLAFVMPGVTHTFKKGHRIMVQIQSTWFPLYDRNPQTFVPNIFRARTSDYRKQTHAVHHAARHPSHVEVHVLETP